MYRAMILGVALVLSGCTKHQVRPYGETYPPTLPGEVEVLYSAPEREHIKIGSLDVRYSRAVGWNTPTVYEAADRIKEAGAELGAHAVVVIDTEASSSGALHVVGEAIRWPDEP